MLSDTKNITNANKLIPGKLYKFVMNIDGIRLHVYSDKRLQNRVLFFDPLSGKNVIFMTINMTKLTTSNFFILKMLIKNKICYTRVLERDIFEQIG